MTQNKSARGPQFINYFNDILDALIFLGGSGRPDEVVTRTIEAHGVLTDAESEQLSDGTPRISKNIHWARFYLTRIGFIDGSNRGV